VLKNGKVILARRIETIYYFCHSCVKKENSNPPKILSCFHTIFMHLYKNVNPLQSGIGEEGQLPYGMRGSKLLEDLH
jgi:hypothetical protein